MDESTAACSDCGATGRKLVRTVCMKCYHRRHAAGRLDDLPKKTTADRFRHLADRTEKRCGTCFVTKPLEAFPKRAGAADGRSSRCKQCYSERAQAKPKIEVPPVGMDSAKCRACGETKPVGEFYWRKDNGKPRQDCKDCMSERGRRAYVPKVKLVRQRPTQEAHSPPVIGPRKPRPKRDRLCLYCGATDYDYPEFNFCSPRCRRRYKVGYVPPAPRPCLACQVEFTPKLGSARYCSTTCTEWARDHPGEVRRWPTECVVCAGPLPGTNIRQDTCSIACHGRKHGQLRRVRRSGLPRERIQKRRVFERDKWVCHICLMPIDPAVSGADGATIDHVIPLAHPGSPGHVWTNVAAAHGRCNSRKRNFPTEADYALRARLMMLYGENAG